MSPRHVRQLTHPPLLGVTVLFSGRPGRRPAGTIVLGSDEVHERIAVELVRALELDHPLELLGRESTVDERVVRHLLLRLPVVVLRQEHSLLHLFSEYLERYWCKIPAVHTDVQRPTADVLQRAVTVPVELP